ncbi:DinB family protein [Pedobacter frigiditerrae]|uniref:DinB family protein n=1 Tax=Pedobacter frigiditerrae TaxID=2530452 RepID=A0A4R0N0U6_9SPHI|nr:DinB family protein [Pedobacter frigiditerrae]TCC91962.1 DinB family protein [Pedobacter frigiditerrae]
MEKDIIISDFNKVFSDLITTVEGFDYMSYNQIPFDGSWTPAQVTQHIILASEGFVKVLNAEVKDAETAIDEKKSQIKAIFLDYGTKMKSPDFILPDLKEYDKERHLAKIAIIQEGIAKAINDLDLGKTCLSFELPGMGHLTRLEAIYFVTYHTERHIHQLKEIHRFQKSA